MPRAATLLKVRDAGTIPSGFQQITCAEVQAYEVIILSRLCL